MSLKLQEVDVAFDSQVVLKNISVEVAKGEVLVLMGPSGQGKTTLLKVMAGLITPRNGKVFINDLDWSTLGNNERFLNLKKLGMLFQKNALFDSFTCGENIAFPLRETTDLSPVEIQSKVDEFLEAVGISHAKNLYPDEISGGMQKRLGIARALALNPEIIFYDDPTAGLDPITSRKIIELIIDLQEKNDSTVVAITNDVNRAYQLADRIGIVVDHELIITGTPEETKKHRDPRVQQFINGALRGPLTDNLVN
ncbi:MAG: ATP-binding cassette domain-containing protein [Bdellovibrionaceae bacterium]|nr:ATP-binding cassette domain-containing protein [Pseudobdellovibrionaceae bacterium]